MQYSGRPEPAGKWVRCPNGSCDRGLLVQSHSDRAQGVMQQTCGTCGGSGEVWQGGR